MRCPGCKVEFSSPYLAEASALGRDIWCPRGCKLSFVPPASLKSAAEQVAALEDLFIKEAR